MGELFGEVLKLCDRAGLVKPGLVSIDGTRFAGNPSPEVNHAFERIAREIVAEARATDEAEDELYGEARGDELPERLRTPEGRCEFFREARRRLRRDEADAEELPEGSFVSAILVGAFCDWFVARAAPVAVWTLMAVPVGPRSKPVA